MIYCTKCGTASQETAEFCTKCGTKLTKRKEAPPVQEAPPIEETQPVQETPPPVQEPTAQELPPMPQEIPQETPPVQDTQPPKKKKTGLIIGLSAAGVVVVAALVLVFVLFLRPSDNGGNGDISEPAPSETPATPTPTPTPTPDPTPTPTPPPSLIGPDGEISRTFMIYIVGSDLETQIGAATLDIMEILESGVDLEWNNVVIMTGGAYEWQNDLMSAESLEIYEITEDDDGNTGIALVHDMPLMSMASPSTLADFLEYCYVNYESSEYNLILWNHGAGPLYGYGYDEIFGEMLSIPQLVSALEQSPFGADNKLDIIGFDACLMGSVEIAFALSEYASYMIASQEVVPGWGWDYSFLGAVDPAGTAEDVAVTIIDTYFEFCEFIFDFRPDFLSDISLSCLNLDSVALLERRLNELYGMAEIELDASSFPSASLVRDSVKEFGRVNPDFSYDLVDIGHLCRLMSYDYPEQADSLSSALGELVSYNRSNIPNAGGVSLYFPYRDREQLSELASFYTGFEFAGDYTGYIQKFVTLLDEAPDINWDMSRTPMVQESTSLYSVQLTPEQIETYASAAYYILMYYTDEDGLYDGYYIVFNSRDVTLDDDDGKLYAHYDGKTQMMLDPDEDEDARILMIEREITDTYLRYVVPIMLVDYSGGFDEWKMDSAWVQIQTDRDGSNVKVLAVFPMSDDDDLSYIPNREIIDIYEYKQLQAWTFGRLPTYNDDGSLIPFVEWESTGRMVGYEINLDAETRDSFQLVQQELDDSQEYYMVINIKDVYGNVVSSDMIKIQR